ncbi:MAG: N-acetylneuraminate synthase [Bdellovibrionota bacterium]
MKPNCTIIAEAGVNHNGDLGLAKKLIDVAAVARADIVKFQTFKTENLVSRLAPKAKYQQTNTGGRGDQFSMLKSLELSDAQHWELVKYCKQKKIEFLSTAFDQTSLDFLFHELKLTKFKIPSGELTNAPLLIEFGRTHGKIILSTGMAEIEEIRLALGILAFGFLNFHTLTPTAEDFLAAFRSIDGQKYIQEHVTLLHCTTEYPAPFAEVNLNAMKTMGEMFKLPYGYSDHTEGLAVPVAAVAMGAVIVEKHFTTDKSLPGPDHRASLTPTELSEMVKFIRQVETALGSREKHPSCSEIVNRAVARKSLVAKSEIKQGEVFSKDNIEVKRPGSGLSPIYYWQILGKKSSRDYAKDELLEMGENK